MANKFYPWLETFNSNSCYTASEYSTLDTRSSGFQGGTVASSKTMNTAVRQSSLVICALMNVVKPNDTTDTSSMTVSTVQGYVNDYFNQFTPKTQAASSSNLGLIKTGYTNLGKNYGVKLNSDNQAYVTATSVPLYKHKVTVDFLTGVSCSDSSFRKTTDRFQFTITIISTLSTPANNQDSFRNLYLGADSNMIAEAHIIPLHFEDEGYVYTYDYNVLSSGQITFKFIQNNVDRHTDGALDVTFSDAVTTFNF